MARKNTAANSGAATPAAPTRKPTVKYTIGLSVEMRDQVAQKAAALELDSADWIRMAIRKALNEGL